MANERFDLEGVTNEKLVAYIVRCYGSTPPVDAKKILYAIREFERGQLHLQDSTTRQDSLQFIDVLTHLIGD